MSSVIWGGRQVPGSPPLPDQTRPSQVVRPLEHAALEASEARAEHVYSLDGLPSFEVSLLPLLLIPGAPPGLFPALAPGLRCLGDGSPFSSPIPFGNARSVGVVGLDRLPFAFLTGTTDSEPGERTMGGDALALAAVESTVSRARGRGWSGVVVGDMSC